MTLNITITPWQDKFVLKVNGIEEGPLTPERVLARIAAMLDDERGNA